MAKGPKAPKESSQERKLASIGARLAEIDSRIGRPLESRLIDRTRNDRFDRSRALSSAHADIQHRFSDAARMAGDSNTGAGAAPGSGRFNAAVAGTRTDEGTAAGFIANDVNAQAEDQKVVNTGSLINYGMGRGASALQGTAQAGRDATGRSIQAARDSAQRRAAIGQAAGDLIAVGGYYGMKAYNAPGAKPAQGTYSPGPTPQTQIGPSSPSMGGEFSPAPLREQDGFLLYPET